MVSKGVTQSVHGGTGDEGDTVGGSKRTDVFLAGLAGVFLGTGVGVLVEEEGGHEGESAAEIVCHT